MSEDSPNDAEQSQSIDAQFELIEEEIIIPTAAPKRGTWHAFKQRVFRFALILSIAVVSIVLLYVAFWLFLALILIAIVLRLFGVLGRSQVEVRTRR